MHFVLNPLPPLPLPHIYGKPASLFLIIFVFILTALIEAGMPPRERTKRKKQTLKIGHGGTLDSPAQGVLGKRRKKKKLLWFTWYQKMWTVSSWVWSRLGHFQSALEPFDGLGLQVLPSFKETVTFSEPALNCCLERPASWLALGNLGLESIPTFSLWWGWFAVPWPKGCLPALCPVPQAEGSWWPVPQPSGH